MNEIHRHDSDIANHSSSLRTKEENFDNVGFESSKPAVGNHEQCSHHSNNVKTKVELSSIHRETVASTMRVTPASSKSSSSGSGGSSNPMSIHPRTKSIYMKKEIPKEDRIWTTIPGCQKCQRDSFETRICKCVTNMLRHHDQDERETDGSMHWNVIPPALKGRFKNQLEKEFTNEDWLQCLYLGSIKTRFEICKHENAVGMIISPRLMNFVMIPNKWKRFIYHLGRARDQYSIAEAGLVAGGKERKEGRQTIFFTPLDPFNSDADEAESITDIKKPRKVQYQIHWRPEQDAVYWIHLSTAQDAGLEFWQTGSNAIITYQSVPKECVVKVVCESGKRELFARQRTPRERPKVTLRPSWVHTRSNTVSMPRETESNLQAWNSDPNASGSGIWPRRESNSLLISESTASPTTKLTRTSSTCKEPQNKFKNL